MNKFDIVMDNYSDEVNEKRKRSMLLPQDETQDESLSRFSLQIRHVVAASGTFDSSTGYYMFDVPLVDDDLKEGLKVREYVVIICPHFKTDIYEILSITWQTDFTAKALNATICARKLKNDGEFSL